MMVAQKLTLARENNHLPGFVRSRTPIRVSAANKSNLEANRVLKRDEMTDHGWIGCSLEALTLPSPIRRASNGFVLHEGV